jgi:hypothetical protein
MLPSLHRTREESHEKPISIARFRFPTADHRDRAPAIEGAIHLVPPGTRNCIADRAARATGCQGHQEATRAWLKRWRLTSTFFLAQWAYGSDSQNRCMAAVSGLTQHWVNWLNRGHETAMRQSLPHPWSWISCLKSQPLKAPETLKPTDISGFEGFDLD